MATAGVIEERKLLLQLELVEERVPDGEEGRRRGVPAYGRAHEVSPMATNVSSAAAPLLTTMLLLENMGGGAHDKGDDTESGDGVVPAPPPPLRPKFWRERRNGECAAEVGVPEPEAQSLVPGVGRGPCVP